MVQVSFQDLFDYVTLSYTHVQIENETVLFIVVIISKLQAICSDMICNDQSEQLTNFRHETSEQSTDSFKKLKRSHRSWLA